MIALFLDGPICGDVREIGEPVPWHTVPLPPRMTVCGCDPDEKEFWMQAEEKVVYHCVAAGMECRVGLFSITNSEDSILKCLPVLMSTDIISGRMLEVGCRSLRAEWS